MSKKICFVTLMNLSAVPYLSKYTDLLNCPYDVIYWNRYGVEESCGAETLYPMQFNIKRDCSKFTKLKGYLKFRSFATRILKQNNYDKVVLLSGNVAVILRSILLSKYRKRYIIDIRDYFKENNSVYYNNEKEVIENSALAVISSKAYTNFLPKHDYVVIHNSPSIPKKQLEDFNVKRKAFLDSREYYPIILSFIGGVRFIEQDKRILQFFGNDERFFIKYIGVGANLLKEYCEKEKITNTYFHDRFPPEKTLDFYVETDFILNLYGNGTPLLDYALSNKLYYAAYLRIPILVCPETYMEDVSTENGFGIVADLDDYNCKERIIDFYRSIDDIQLEIKCQKFVDETCKENDAWARAVSNVLR